MSDEKPFPVRTLLFGSLAVNLLLVGGVIGVLVSGARLHRPMGGPEFGPGARGFMRALPPEHESQLRTTLENSWKASEAERNAARDARQALFSAVTAQPFDDAKVRAALAKVRAADEALATKNQDAVLGVLKDLEPRERAAAIMGLTRGRMMGGPDGGGRTFFIQRGDGPGPMGPPDDHPPMPPGEPPEHETAPAP